METSLGKIASLELLHEDGRIGFSFTLESEGWVVMDFWGYWSTEWRPECKWSNADRHKSLGHSVMKVKDLMSQAKVDRMSKLVGKPVEAKFAGGRLSSWRILTEVI